MKLGVNSVKIDGHEYVKCHVPDKQWGECLTPCALCHENVQRECKLKTMFCGDEQVVYIDFSDIQTD